VQERGADHVLAGSGRRDERGDLNKMVDVGFLVGALAALLGVPSRGEAGGVENFQSVLPPFIFHIGFRERQL
jgi:hypothetical protein